MVSELHRLPVVRREALASGEGVREGVREAQVVEEGVTRPEAVSGVPEGGGEAVALGVEEVLPLLLRVPRGALGEEAAEALSGGVELPPLELDTVEVGEGVVEGEVAGEPVRGGEGVV